MYPVAILAELVAWRHARPRAGGAVAEAIDPVSGMAVSVAASAEVAVHGGVGYRFCSPGCRARFEAARERYLGRQVVA